MQIEEMLNRPYDFRIVKQEKLTEAIDDDSIVKPKQIIFADGNGNEYTIEIADNDLPHYLMDHGIVVQVKRLSNDNAKYFKLSDELKEIITDYFRKQEKPTFDESWDLLMH